IRCAEEKIRAKNGGRRLDWHDESHRAALRHRSWPAAYESSETERRKLQDHRYQNFYLCGRARPFAEHHPSRPRPYRRRAGGYEGYIAVRGAEVSCKGRWLNRRAQRSHLRLNRRENGHPRQFDLRYEL